jgi:LasA protease
MRAKANAGSALGMALLGCATLSLLGLGAALMVVLLTNPNAATLPAQNIIIIASNTPAAATPTATLMPSPTTDPATATPPIVIIDLVFTATPNHTATPTLPPPTLPLPTLTPPAGPTTPGLLLLPDGAVVNSSQQDGYYGKLDLVAFIASQPGYINGYSETVSGRVISAAEAIDYAARNTSLSPRLLLALIEHKSGWLSQPQPASLDKPLGEADGERVGLFRSLLWAANTINNGYYGYKTRGLAALSLPDGAKLAFHPALNPGTAALQYFFAQGVFTDSAAARPQWDFDVSAAGFAATYKALFGDAYASSETYQSLWPPNLTQPVFQLPFLSSELWRLGAGPHGGWDRKGSAWGALDLAPPRPSDQVLATEGKCYLSDYFVRAVAPGMVVRARDGVVVLDLDMDGDERTGWVVVYLHIALEDRAALGSLLAAGDAIGRPSCDGFYLSAVNTHVHIARRYNGEWIAAECTRCLPGANPPPFVMGNWVLRGYPNEASFGWLQNAAGLRLEMGDDITW